MIGKVWFTIPLVGHVVQFANQPTGMAVLIGVPFALLAVSELWARSGPTAVRSAGSGDAGGNEGVDDRVLPQFEDDDTVEDGTQNGGGISISATDLRLGALGFGTFAIYAIYVALGNPSGISVGVAVGATIAAGFHLAGLATLALADGAESPGSPESPAPGDPRGGGADD